MLTRQCIDQADVLAKDGQLRTLEKNGLVRKSFLTISHNPIENAGAVQRHVIAPVTSGEKASQHTQPRLQNAGLPDMSGTTCILLEKLKIS